VIVYISNVAHNREPIVRFANEIVPAFA